MTQSKPLTNSGVTIEQVSQTLANYITENIPDTKERLYALMNLEQTMLWYYQYMEKERRKAEAEENSVSYSEAVDIVENIE